MVLASTSRSTGGGTRLLMMQYSIERSTCVRKGWGVTAPGPRLAQFPPEDFVEAVSRLPLDPGEVPAVLEQQEPEVP